MLSVGTIGIVIFYLVLAKLSARMGNGLGLAPYYLWDYVACIIALSSIYVHAQLHPIPQHASLDVQGLYISLLLLSNVIVVIVSFKYWWWLKDELGGKSEQGGKSNE
ncbi:MAG: hypothetical protein ABOK23_10125 [Candidatus Methanoperedens sp.]|nr:hypothetical protein [Candidatus Methanoperedens sp.]MCZ7396787.1 hypothetical protein [Candidatus Methanoperedens sp.]